MKPNRENPAASHRKTSGEAPEPQHTGSERMMQILLDALAAAQEVPVSADPQTLAAVEVLGTLTRAVSLAVYGKPIHVEHFDCDGNPIKERPLGPLLSTTDQLERLAAAAREIRGDKRRTKSEQGKRLREAMDLLLLLSSQTSSADELSRGREQLMRISGVSVRPRRADIDEAQFLARGFIFVAGPLCSAELKAQMRSESWEDSETAVLAAFKKLLLNGKRDAVLLATHGLRGLGLKKDAYNLLGNE